MGAGAVGTGTEFVITDNGWNCKTEDRIPGGFRGGEGVVSWRADKYYVAGTVVAYPATNAGVWSSVVRGLAQQARAMPYGEDGIL